MLLVLFTLSVLIPTIILLIRYGVALKRIETTKRAITNEVEGWFSNSSEVVKLKIHLFKETSWNYSEFKKLNRLVELESNWKVDALGDGGKAFGPAQFWETTFNQFKGEAGMPELKYRDPQDQLTLMAWAVRNNLGYHWTTYKNTP